ncbi:hypothetical protein WJX74_004583 [Apatococcus lobatus]|uniref:CCT domain-containing protein n=1 Tax=Apatococcus lobatus TaxID=904363 RepID=A0AAW1PZQ3_9CHLO
MDGRSTASPHRSSYSSPLDSSDCGWGLQDFSDFNSVDVVSPASFRGPTFTYGDDVDKMFRNSHEQADFNEALRAFESSGDFIDDKQVVMAAAAAAGLNKGGLKRTAFSMGDLQALQPPTSGPPSPPQMQPQRSGSNLSVAKAPRLESVPEGAVASVATPSSIPAATDLDFSDMLAGHQPFSESVTDPLDDLGLGHFADSLLDVKPVIDWGATNAQPGPSHSMPSHMYFGQQPGSTQGLRMAEMMLDSQGGNMAPNDVHGLGLSAESKDDPAMTGLAESFLASTSGSSLQQQQQQQPSQHQSQQQQQLRQPPQQLPRPHQPLMQVMQAHHLRPPLPQGPLGPGPGIRPTPGMPMKQEHTEKFMRRSQSAVELRSLASLPRSHSEVDLREQEESALAELTTPEGHTYKVGRLSNEERAQKILKYRQKRHERNFNKRIKYQCRKTLADSRPRVRGRFARNDDAGAVMPHETKKALAEKAKKEKQDTSCAQPAKPPSVQPFMPSTQGPNQMSFVPMSRPAGPLSRPPWPSTSSTPTVSPFIPAAAPNWPAQPTFVPTPHNPSQSAPVGNPHPSASTSGQPTQATNSMGARSGGTVSPPSQVSVPRVGSMPMPMGSGRPLGANPQHLAPAARSMPKVEPVDHSFPQWLPTSGAWPSSGGSYGSHDHLLEQLDQQLDQQLPLSADGTPAYDSSNLGFMPFDL